MTNTNPQTQRQTPAAQASGSSNKRKLVAKMAEKFGVEANSFWDTLKATAFKQRNGQAPTNEQMMALLVVADQYELNPFTKEIYAFPDQQNGIIPIVGVDGWSRIINHHAQFDGMEFRFSETTINLPGLPKPIFEWIECVMYRKDRTRPTVIREYLEEIYKEPIKKTGANGPYEIRGPWQTHTRRFARHKVIIQTARIALGYTGIYDQDEAENILESQISSSSSKRMVDINNVQTVALPASKSSSSPTLLDEVNQSAIQGMLDSSSVLMSEAVLVQSEQPTKPSAEQLAEETKSIPVNAVVQTSFGAIAAKDHAMISQMVDYTIQTGAWKATFESFNERYSGTTLDYALDVLTQAQVDK